MPISLLRRRSLLMSVALSPLLHGPAQAGPAAQPARPPQQAPAPPQAPAARAAPAGSKQGQGQKAQDQGQGQGAQDQGQDQAAEPGPAAGPLHADPNDDPRARRPADLRRADAVELRHLGRQLVMFGQATGNPLALVSAAQVLQQAPPPRPGPRPAQVEGSRGALFREGVDVPPPTATPGTLLARLDPAAILAEARNLASTKVQTLGKETLAIIDQISAQITGQRRAKDGAEVITRGSLAGPQQSCDRLLPGMRLTYNIIYEGGEKAVVAIVGEGPGELWVQVSDDEGNAISRTVDRSLIAWYPRWRGVFRVSVENRSAQAMPFCIETN